MASADFLQFRRMSPRAFRGCQIPSLLHGPARPPRVSSYSFPSPICRIYTTGFGQYWTSLCLASSSVPQMPSMRFLFVRPRVCLQFPSDSSSRRTPLPSAMVPTAKSIKVFHLVEYAHAGRTRTKIRAPSGSPDADLMRMHPCKGHRGGAIPPGTRPLLPRRAAPGRDRRPSEEPPRPPGKRRCPRPCHPVRSS